MPTPNRRPQESELPFKGVLVPTALPGGPLARHAPGSNP